MAHSFKKIVLALLIGYFSQLLVIKLVAQNKYTPIDSLLVLIKTNKYDTNYVKNLNLISRKYHMISNYIEAKNFAQKAKNISEKINYRKGTVNAYKNLGIIYRKSSNYDSALIALSKASQMTDSLKDKLEIASIANLIGATYFNKGNYEECLIFFFRALKINEEIKNNEGIGVSLGSIANFYFQQKNIDKALEFYFKILKIPENKDNYHIIYMSIGNCCSAKKKYEKALFYLLKALTISDKVGDKITASTILMNIGVVYNDKREYSKSILYYKKALIMNAALDNKKGATECFLNIGLSYFHLNDFIEAEKNFKSALKIAVNTGNKLALNEIYNSICDLYEVEGKYKQALTYQKLYTSVKDTLYNIKSSKKINEMGAKYESELRDKELIKKDAKIRIQQVQKETETTTKNVFIVSFIFLLGLITFVYYSYLQKQKINQLLDERNQNITSSFNYAKLIQNSILPSQEDLRKYLPKSFVFYQPKDIVSGDFYWLYPINKNVVIFAVVDCTGHGVPGALLSVLGRSLLDRIMHQNTTNNMAELLNQLSHLVIESLKQSENTDNVQNGMDMVIFKFDYSTSELEFAGAKNSLYIVRDFDLIELKGDRKSVGLLTRNLNPFTNQTIKLQQGDHLYAFTDGYLDQKGGLENKKFQKANFKKLLISINSLDAVAQQEHLKTAFSNWIGANEQMDDVLVFGVKF